MQGRSISAPRESRRRFDEQVDMQVDYGGWRGMFDNGVRIISGADKAMDVMWTMAPGGTSWVANCNALGAAT